MQSIGRVKRAKHLGRFGFLTNAEYHTGNALMAFIPLIWRILPYPHRKRLICIILKIWNPHLKSRPGGRSDRDRKFAIVVKLNDPAIGHA